MSDKGVEKEVSDKSVLFFTISGKGRAHAMALSETEGVKKVIHTYPSIKKIVGFQREISSKRFEEIEEYGLAAAKKHASRVDAIVIYDHTSIDNIVGVDLVRMLQYVNEMKSLPIILSSCLDSSVKERAYKSAGISSVLYGNDDPTYQSLLLKEVNSAIKARIESDGPPGPG